MRRFFFALLAGSAVVLVAGSDLLASPLPPSNVSWTYDFTAGAPAVMADGNPGAGISFTNEVTKEAVGSSDVVATNLRVFSAAPASMPDTLSGSNGDYSLRLSLNLAGPDALPTPVTMMFKGTLSGTFSADNASVTNVFDPAFSTATASLGGYTFKVSLIAYTPPGPPSQTNAGSIAAHVQVSRNPDLNDVPEPGSLVLSGLGLSLLGGMAWRQRQQRRSPVF